MGGTEKEMSVKYPGLSEDVVLTLKLVKAGMDQYGDDYFDDAECPYSEATKKFLRGFLVKGVERMEGVEDVANIFDGDDVVEVEVLDVQIQKILSRMDAMEKELGGMEPNERLNFFKTRTALMEKLINMREKTENLRMLSEFKAVVVSVLEDVCDADQINEFRRRLGAGE